MNKVLSQAIKKAVTEYTNNFVVNIENNSQKKTRYISLSDNTELFQNSKGITIKIDRSKDQNLTDFGKATLSDRYLGHNELFQDLFIKNKSHYADDNLHAQRLYNYISNLWFMPATPVSSQTVEQKEVYLLSCFFK